ncbi:MAG TPA: glutaredoxin 3 [Caulobacteraceae bacterium]|nr:glutaredoxin 3 [Caulobacteraceae bacterium]
MAHVTIYTRPFCGYCSRALSLLKAKGAEVTEIEAGFSPEKRAEMTRRAGGARTFPQIFVGEAHVGGCDELIDLERRGELDALLAA